MSRIYRLTNLQVAEIQSKVKSFLEQRGEIVFAYLHGSFLEGSFRDIDIAVFLTGRGKEQILPYELGLEGELNDLTGFLADARVLNHAPLSFRFNVIKNGKSMIRRFGKRSANAIKIP